MKIYRCDVLNDKKYKYFSSLQKAMDFVISDTLAYYKDKDISYYYNEYMKNSGNIALFFKRNKNNELFTCGFIAEIEVEE